MHAKVESVFRKILHLLEQVIAALSLVVLLGMLGMEVYRIFTVDGYFSTAHTFLHNTLTIVVGLEFVRMLVDMTPANTIEVLIVAISRQVIVNHDNPVSNLISVFWIAGLFATRRYLIPKKILKVDLSEGE